MPTRVPSDGSTRSISSGRMTTSTGLLLPKPFVHAGKLGTEDLYQLVAEHHARDDVALADEVSHERVLRFVVDLLRGTHLLDVTLVHDNNGIGHGQCLFLVMGNVDEGDAQLIL